MVTMVTKYRIIKIYRNGIIKLPADIRHSMGLRENDEFIVTVENDRIVLIPRRLIDPVESYCSELGREVDEDLLLEEGTRSLRRIMNI